MSVQTDVQFWKDTITSELEAICNLIELARNATDDTNKLQALASADMKIRSTKSTTGSFKKEIRLIFDHQERSRYTEDLKGYEQSIARFATDVKTLRSGQEGRRMQLFLGVENNINDSDGCDPEEDNAVAAGDAMLKGVGILQEKTGQSLNRTSQMIEETKQTATLTVNELRQQTEQLQEVETNVIKAKSGMGRADKLIKTFRKRIATDKLIQCFACCNIMIIVGIVVVSAIKGRMKDDESPVDKGRRILSLRGSLPVPYSN